MYPTFWQLILARTGVGIGETGGMAPWQAIISEMHPPRERATAQGALSAGIKGVQLDVALDHPSIFYFNSKMYIRPEVEIAVPLWLVPDGTKVTTG